MRIIRNIFSLFLLVGVFSFLATFSTSCSGDNPLVSEKEIGNLNDSTFEVAEDILSDLAFNVEALAWFDGIFDSIPGLNGGASPSRDFDNRRLFRTAGDSVIIQSYSLVIDTVNWWYIFTLVANDGNNTASIVDSVQVSGPNGPGSAEVLGDDVNNIKVRAHVQITSNDSTDFVGTIGAHVSGEVTVLSIDTVDQVPVSNLSVSMTAIDTIAGTVYDSSGTCDITITSMTNAVNLVSQDEPDTDCPSSGTISVSATLDLACVSTGQTDTLEISGSWAVAVTFNGDGTASVVYEDETTRWTTEINCSNTVSGSPLNNISFRPSDQE